MAIKTLDTLIKLHKHRLDLVRRELANLTEQIEQLEYVKKKLLNELQQEIEMVSNNPDYASFFGAYAKHSQQRQMAITTEIHLLQQQAEAKREIISLEFAEQKKYEIARTQQMKKAMAEENLRNQQALDEIAMQQHSKSLLQ